MEKVQRAGGVYSREEFVTCDIRVDISENADTPKEVGRIYRQVSQRGFLMRRDKDIRAIELETTASQEINEILEVRV